MDSLLDIPLGEALGAGGFATVYGLGSDRVAKIALVSHDLARARIAREAEALGAIGAPAVPALHGSGVLPDGRAWLVMDRVAGTTFAELTSAGPMPVAEATRLAIGMLDALGRVHAAGFVHRDLKPDNLFRTSAGKVVVIDLGLARKIPTDPDDPTRANVQVGSLEYLPPEQLVDAASVDERSDLYAFGCVFFELLAGRPPFTGDAAALERAHAALRPPRLDSLVDVPATVAQVVHDCLAKDPAQRPRMASRVRAQLVSTHEDTGFRTGSQPVSIIRESKQPVVILYAELPRVDRSLLGMFAARRLVIASQKGRRVIAGAIGGEHGDPAALALAAATDLAAAGARVALHLDSLRVGAGPTLHGEPIEKPETWLPASAWTGVLISRALASVIQAPTRDADDHPGFRALGGEAERREVFGREALLTDLAGDAAVALTGRVRGPGFALVVGDAGIGKTVLAAELASRLRELGAVVHSGAIPLPGTGKPAFSALGTLAPTAGVRAIGDALRAAARERPTAVILDDLHLADHELFDALEYATLGGEPLPLWILGLAAPRIATRRPHLGERAERHRRDVLGALDEDAAVALAAKLLEPAEYPPLRALRRLVALAEGNPLHLATLAREIHERGAIRARAGGVHFFDTGVLDELSPVALGPWLAARELAGLAEELVALARICAVLAGDAEVERDELIAIVDAVERAGGATTTVDAGVGLHELEVAGLLVSSERGYQFRQNLVEEGIYATTGEAERLAIHGAALAYWRRDFSDDVRAAIRIARHAEVTGEAPIAARAYAVLARQAHAEHRLLDADRAWQGALRNLPAREADRARALLGRADARVHQQRAQEAIRDVEEAIAIAIDRGEVELEVEARFALATTLDIADDYARSATEAEIALARVATIDPPAHVRDAALYAAGRTPFRAQHFAEAAPKLRETIEVARAHANWDIEITASLLLGPALVELRELDEAEALFARVIAACAQRDDRFHQAAAYGNRAWLWSARGATERSAEDVRLLIQMAREVGAASLERVGTYNLAEDRLWQGALAEALQLARRSVAIQISAGDSTRWDRILLGRVLAARGDTGELRDVLASLAPEDLAPDERTVVELLTAAAGEADAARWDELLARTLEMTGAQRLELLHLAAKHGRLGAAFRGSVAELVAGNLIWAPRVHEF